MPLRHADSYYYAILLRHCCHAIYAAIDYYYVITFRAIISLFLLTPYATLLRHAMLSYIIIAELLYYVCLPLLRC